MFACLSERGTPTLGMVIARALATILISMNYTKGLVGEFTFIILIAT